MSKATIRTIGEQVNSNNNPTLRTLSPGETFRFPNSHRGIVYQLLSVSDGAQSWGLKTGRLKFVYVNVATGQLFGDRDNHEVVPVDVTVTARERAVKRRSTRTTTSVRARRSR